MVLNQNGIFERAENSVDKHEQASAREKLELALGEVQMMKYEEGLSGENYENRLDNKVQEIGELLDKDINNPNYQQVVVDGYIFLIDRSVPKIVDYIGPADGVVITASINTNNGYLGTTEGKVNIKGIIKTYSGGTITNVKATKDETEITDFSIDSNGGYSLDITENTTVIIYAEDNNGKTNSKRIPIEIKIDNTAPTVQEVTTTAERMTIKFSATGHDKNERGEEESGIKEFKYTITSTEDKTLAGIPSEKITGTFTEGQTVEIITTPTGDRDGTKYSITVTAIDNVGNSTPDTEAKTGTATTENYLTVAEAKSLVTSTNALRQYMGTKVIDYKTGELWRIFYYDPEMNNTGKGKFGPKGIIYLKKSAIGGQMALTTSSKTEDTDPAVQMMKRMNPMWANSNFKTIDTGSEQTSVWINDPEVWNEHRNPEFSSFAIGSSSVEMFVDAYNVWESTTDPDRTLWTHLTKDGEYCVNRSEDDLVNGEGNMSGSFSGHSFNRVLGHDGGISSGVVGYWLGSPGYMDPPYRSKTYSMVVDLWSWKLCAYMYYYGHAQLCPIVPLDIITEQ